MGIDREKLREALPTIVDAGERQAETSRIEARYALEAFVIHDYTAKHGRMPTPDVQARQVEDILSYVSGSLNARD